MNECEHEFGPVEIARFTGNPHRRCIHCRFVTLDLTDEEDDDNDDHDRREDLRSL